MKKPLAADYTGELKEPRKPWGPLPLIDTDQEIERRRQIDAAEFERKLTLLLRHYAVKTTNELLIALIHAHVPGFQFGRGRSAESYWTPAQQFKLVLLVGEYLDAGKSIEHAIAALIKAGTFRAKTTGSLRRRYEEARRSTAGLDAINLRKLAMRD